jgi:glycosyltransferase involved in cell wall biosynthesis
MEKIILSIFVPCFNEENNITQTLNNIKKGAENISYEILIADDASKDNTIKMINDFKKSNSNLNIKIFQNEVNKGIGFNYYKTAYKATGQYYMMVNGDAVDPPSEIKKIISNIGKADMVVTYLIDKRGAFRKTISRMFVALINLITFNNLKYYNGPNVHLVENVKTYSGKRSGFGYQAELITTQIRHKKTYIQVEIDPYAKSSKSDFTSQSLNPRNIPSVIVSIMSIFLNQIIYLFKKILKIN